ncbi:DUF3592 domain-containing protein [Bacillus sp. JJ1566]|uniref:DUF3592 domain-containing protein n=1 Tax=Bacillus sp. JJ1566 TaxID=3122961 RepID=UPI002FFF61C5
MEVISFLKENGLFNFGDLILLFIGCITLCFFAFRTALFLYFNRVGVPFSAKIISYEKVPVLKNSSVDGVYIDAYQYNYQYEDQKGTKYNGTLKRLFLRGRYEIGDEIQIRYLKNNPNISRVYNLSDWYMYEFMSLIIAIVLFSIVMVKTLIGEGV